LKQLFYVILLLVLVLLLGLKFLLHYDAHGLLFWLVSCGYILFFTSSVPLLSLINTMRMRKLVALISSGERFFQLLFLLGVYYLVGLNATLVLLVFLTVAAFSFAAKVKILKREAGAGPKSDGGFADKLPRDFLQLLVSFGLPLLGFGILAWLQTNGERWAVQLVMGLDSVGIFCFMAMLSTTIINVIVAPLGSFIGPIIWEKFADMNNALRVADAMRMIWLNVIFCSLIIICGAVFLLIFGKYLLTLLGSAVFASHYRLLPVIFAGIGLYYIGQGLTSVGFGFNKMIKYTLPKAIAAFLTIFCYLGGAYYWGLPGVAWGLILVNATYVLLIFMTNKRIARAPLAS
jgi:O-antigen/teichoic acid export membrane protein